METSKPQATVTDDRSAVEKAKEKLKGALDSASDSEFVDSATNAAAEIVRSKGHGNSAALASRIDLFWDSLSQKIPGFWGKIVRRLPMKRFLRKAIKELVDTIADWLEDFSDASDKN